MPLAHSLPPLTAGDDELAGMVAQAELPALLITLAHITGDLSLLDPALRPPLRPSLAAIEPQGGMSPEAQTRAREVALEALKRFRDGGSRVLAEPGPEELHRLMSFLTGEVDEEYVPLLQHELGFPVDAGAPEWTVQDVAPGRELSAVVVGAGMSGLAAAHRLRQAGIAVTVLERNPDVGGVWFENGYPGCRLDTNNFHYSYSFAQKEDWPQQFSSRDSIYGYFRAVAEDLTLRELIRFRTEVTSAAWDDVTARWRVTCAGPDGVQVLDADVVVSAVGQLNTPNIPGLPGQDRFVGLSFHTARWPEGLDLTGKRVAVIGTGASAYQVVPSIVDQVGELHVYQRTAPWMLPTPTYHDDIAPGLRALFERVPFYARWYRFFQFWTAVEGRRAIVQVDPEWTEKGSVSAVNAAVRRGLEEHIRSQYTDRPDLAERVVPEYPPGAKRMLRDNGVWARALKQPHVELVTERILEITEKGIRTADGEERAVDVIVWGTGFKASDFLDSMTVRGRGGVDLHEQWGGDARAYLGIQVPHFPNLFCLYGPNTNLVVNGSILLFSECAIHYSLECLRQMLAGGHRSVEVSQQAFDEFSRAVDAGNAAMAWGASDVNSWYKNAFGRVTQNWPFTLLEYWQRTRRPEPGAIVLA